MTDAIKLPKATRKRLVKIIVDSQKGGTNTQIDETRLNLKQAAQSENLIQVQDGVWQTRWGMASYGSAIAGESGLDGATEYVASNGDTEIIAVGSTTGKVWKTIDDGANWTEVTGATMTAGNKCFFLQVGYELWITNETDRLTVYDGTNLVKNTQISAPTNLTATRGSGLSAGDYTYYFTVVALNEVGFTNESAEVEITVDKPRNEWTDTSTEKIALDWDDASGASRYEVYISDESGSQIYLDGSVGSAYTDDGTAEPNIYVESPGDNTTGGPILGKITYSNGRVWGIDKENEYVVYGGTGQYQKYFSWYYGGGSIELEKGGGEIPEAVVHYRTGKGTPVATILTSSPEGRGSIWQAEFDSISIGSETIIIPVAQKIVGSIGANSASSVVQARDNIYFTNVQAVFALKNRAQLFNVLSTDEQSVNIRPSYLTLINSENMTAYYNQGKIFFSGNTSASSANDITFIYDLEQNNWNWKWDVGFSQFFEFTDSSGYTKFIGIKPGNNQLFVLGESYDTDDGQSFSTSWLSGLYHVNPKDHTEFAKIDEAIVELGNAKGTINFELLGVEKNKPLAVIAQKTISDTASSNAVDFANDLFGDYEFSGDPETPSTLSQSIIKKRIKVRKLLNQLQYRISSTEAGAKYTILSTMAKGKIIPTRSPSLWNE